MSINTQSRRYPEKKTCYSIFFFFFFIRSKCIASFILPKELPLLVVPRDHNFGVCEGPTSEESAHQIIRKISATSFLIVELETVLLIVSEMASEACMSMHNCTVCST